MLRKQPSIFKRLQSTQPKRLISYQKPRPTFGFLQQIPLYKRFAILGTGVAATVVFGPILLLGLGGLAAVGAFRLWRSPFYDLFKRVAKDQQEYSRLQQEAFQRLSAWARTESGHAQLVELGLYLEHITERARLISTESSKTIVNGVSQQQVKLQFELTNHTQLVVHAVMNEELVNIRDIQIVKGFRKIKVPAYTQGRVIEGEFHDIQ
ncbi:hypothetical protein G6F43_005695 [Rhizopus delemar]|nr:hypothetical protein G6F43_005695 [Rhizopus delemar]